MPSLICVHATHGPTESAAIAGDDALLSSPPSVMPAGPATRLHQPCATLSLGNASVGGGGTTVGKDSESPVTESPALVPESGNRLSTVGLLALRMSLAEPPI